MKIIAHLDMDAFFASIEEADSPILKGKPIVVGSDPKQGYGRGVVSTANYKAREYGIRSALPISMAWHLSQKAKAEGKPEIIFLPVDMKRYEQISLGVYNIIKENLPSLREGLGMGSRALVEPASIDEFYFDLSFCHNYSEAQKICQKIKKDIKQKYKITCSVGIGPNKLIAKIAVGMRKPDGLFIVRQKDVESFLEPLLIRELPGIGPKTEQFLNTRGIKIIKDIKKFSCKDLHDMLGKHGINLYYKAKGIDNSELVENREVKSIGEQATFQYDTNNALYIGDVFEKLCKSVFQRFNKSEFSGFKTVTITVRFSDFITKTSAKTLPKISASEKVFKLESLKLLLSYLDSRKNPGNKKIRLIGVRLEKLK